MRKLTSAALALVLSAALILPVVGTGPPRLTLSSGEVRPGEAVTLTLSVADSPGLAACMAYFYYDTSVFTADPDTDVAAAGAFRDSGMIRAGKIENMKAKGTYDGDESKDGVAALWFGMISTENGGDETLMELTLHAAASAPEGEYEIGVGYSDNFTRDSAREDIVLSCEGGTLSVRRSAAVQTGEIAAPNGEEIQAILDGEVELTPDVIASRPARPSPAGEMGSAGTVSEKPEPEKPAETPPEPEPEPMLPEFNDIAGNWAEYYIKKIAARGVMNGMGNGRYAPDAEMRRCEYATILWRAEGSPEPKGAAGFTDLDPTQEWYHKAVAWAGESGVMNGVGNGRFDPNGAVTREQLVTILHRLAGSPTGMEAMLGTVYDAQYADSGKIQSWAKPALYWAINKGVYCGDGGLEIGAELLPGKPADRAQIAVMMERYLESEEDKQ